MSAPLLLDLSHTSHTRARTGIQRVVRALHAALGNARVPVTFDPYARHWRTLEPWEHINLAVDGPARKRGARWPLGARLRSSSARIFGRSRREVLPANSGVVVPEVFSPGVARALPQLFAATTGPRVAIFHDAIALKLPELTPVKTVTRFPAYLVELLAFDGVVAVSEESRLSLLDYWAWLGQREVPRVTTLGWGVELRARTPPAAAKTDTALPVVLSVGSIEGRKNHLALLEACEQLWARKVQFRLHLIGLSHPETGASALARIAELQAAGRPLRYEGPLTDALVDEAYAACAFSIYPSLIEGFGLPVLESLSHGKPCVCSARGALGESARGGGCLALPNVDAPSIAAALDRLLHSPAELEQLAAAARRRTFKTWSQYAAELRGWILTLPRRK